MAGMLVKTGHIVKIKQEYLHIHILILRKALHIVCTVAPNTDRNN